MQTSSYLDVRESEIVPAGLGRRANAELVVLLNVQELRDFLWSKVDSLNISRDPRGSRSRRDRLGWDYCAGPDYMRESMQCAGLAQRGTSIC